MYRETDRDMSLANSQANDMVLNHVQTSGADDRLRTAIRLLPTEMQSFWFSLMDDRNGAFATALNDLEEYESLFRVR
jgi:hypothetical protein